MNGLWSSLRIKENIISTKLLMVIGILSLLGMPLAIACGELWLILPIFITTTCAILISRKGKKIERK